MICMTWSNQNVYFRIKPLHGCCFGGVAILAWQKPSSWYARKQETVDYNIIATLSKICRKDKYTEKIIYCANKLLCITMLFRFSNIGQSAISTHELGISLAPFAFFCWCHNQLCKSLWNLIIVAQPHLIWKHFEWKQHSINILIYMWSYLTLHHLRYNGTRITMIHWSHIYRSHGNSGAMAYVEFWVLLAVISKPMGLGQYYLM